jgi:hypothetical protein
MNAQQFDLLARHLAPVSRRRILQTLAFVWLPSVPAAQPAGEWVINIARPSQSNCAGCTSGGGLACFAQNSCPGRCVLQQSFDCAGHATGIRFCCPGCTKPCEANIPCKGVVPAPKKHNHTIASDTCPVLAGASTPCQYYARKNRQFRGECEYYNPSFERLLPIGCWNAAQCCEDPPPPASTSTGLSIGEIDCIRQCLQIADSQLGDKQRSPSGCPTMDAIGQIHDMCFEECGVISLRFWTRMYRWFGGY